MFVYGFLLKLSLKHQVKDKAMSLNQVSALSEAP